MKTCFTSLILLTFSFFSNATLITSLTGGEALVLPQSNQFTSGPVNGNGFTWSSSDSSSVYGFTSGYGLDTNGDWNSGLGFPYVGLNTSTGTMTFTFTEAVSSILGFFNYAPANGPTSSISIFDTSNNLLESFNLIFSTSGNNQGQYLGFSRNSNEIGSFVMSNSFIVGGDFSIARVSTTPNNPPDVVVSEPSFFSIIGLGLGILVLRRLRSK